MATRMICETCGGELNIAADGLSGKCPYCRNTYYFKEEKSEDLTLALNRARGHRLSCDFHEAIKEYKLVLDEHPNDAEAHFGMLLSTYGIEFVEDRRTNRYIPTCHRFVEKDVLTNENYLSAISNASSDQIDSYRSAAEAIARLQKGIKAKLESEEPYEVFISFKSNDEEGRPTEDSVIARHIYDELEKKGIKTFFSEVTLRDRIGDEYEPIIYRALYSCKFFVLIATRESYVNAPWVKNEWTRFEDRIAEEGLSGASCAVFRGISPYVLPRAFQNQGIDVEKHPFDYAITAADSIERKIRSTDSAKEMDELRRQLEELKKQVAGGNGQTPKKPIIPTPISKTPKLVAPAPMAEEPNPIAHEFSIDSMAEFEKICEVKDGVARKCKDRSIKKIIIPSGIKKIEPWAFEGCIKLISVSIPDSVTNIGANAFLGCTSLTSLTIGNGVTSIGSSAFSCCSKLESVTIPDSIKSIKYNAFYECTSLKSVTIGNGVTSIGEHAFSGCTSLTSLTIGNGVTSIGSNAFSCCSKLESVTFPDSVTSIERNAFYRCTSLISVTIGNGVTNIGEFAFGDCYRLVEIINRSSLNIAAGSGDYGCAGLYSIEVHNEASKIINKNNYLFYIKGDANYLIGYSGTETRLVLPESYNSENYKIYENALRNCSSLVSVTIPNSVTSIGNSAFLYCSSLTSVTIPKRFEGKLKGIFPDKVLAKKEVFHFSAAQDSPEENILEIVNGVLVRVHNRSITDIDIPEGVVKIGDRALEGCKLLTSVKIPETVKEIGDSAFYKCVKLESVSIPDSVYYIGVNAFNSCTALREVKLPSSLSHVDGFGNCTSLSHIDIPKTVRSICSWAFTDCVKLDEVVLPPLLEDIGDWAFYGCRSLKKIEIPYTVKTAGRCSFEKCPALKSMKLPYHLKGSLDEMTGLKESERGNISIEYVPLDPKKFKTKGGRIEECLAKDIYSVEIPEGVIGIESYAFKGCARLKHVTVSDSVESIAENAFADCAAIEAVTIPKRFKSEIKDIFPKEIFKLFGGAKITYI